MSAATWSMGRRPAFGVRVLEELLSVARVRGSLVQRRRTNVAGEAPPRQPTACSTPPMSSSCPSAYEVRRLPDVVRCKRPRVTWLPANDAETSAAGIRTALSDTAAAGPTEARESSRPDP